MALVKTVLSDAFKALVDHPPTTARAAADAYAAAYQLYASSALAGVVPPTFTGTEQVKFANILFAVLNVLPGTPANAAAAYVAGVTAFWLTPPVVFGAGVVTAFAGAPAMLAALTLLFGVINDRDTFAGGLADILDTATKTVVVVIGPSTFNLS